MPRDFAQKQSSPLTFNRLLFCAIIAFTAWYVILAAAHYLSQRPLWNDEECVLRSLKAFSAKQMFGQELASLQVFPRVHLFLIQQFAKPFDFHLLALRLPSFLCMLAAFFLWQRIAKIEFKNKIEYLTFVMSWPASSLLLYYSAELKQYSMDVLVGAVFILFLINQEKWIREKKPLAGPILILLPALILFSYITIFFCLLPLYNLFVLSREDKGARRRIFPYIASLLLFLSVAYLFDMRFRPTTILLREWNDYFVSTASVPEFFKTFGEGTMNLLARWFVERPKILKKIGVFFVMSGFLYMFFTFFKQLLKERGFPKLNSLSVIAPVLYGELLILGILHKYPFTVARTSLFFCPVVLYFAVKSIMALKNFNVYIYRLVHGFYFSYLLFLIAMLSGIALSGQLTFRPVLW